MSVWIELTGDVIDEAEIVERVTTPSSGAVVTFRGVVRNEHHGRSVERLDYSAYEPMARATMTQIGDELRERWPVLELAIVHRLGTLEVGEASIFIALALAHRAEGFDALRYSIDRFKEIVPIWKKEHFRDGSSEWVHQGH
ncbi:MAG: molybdenum cofactor biosynthesis protein MoaE [Planctomycetes bacterium]|nr:molybdenum cofactor biosynthesis protein MoaE [Planctomycetota bacterium]